MTTSQSPAPLTVGRIVYNTLFAAEPVTTTPAPAIDDEGCIYCGDLIPDEQIEESRRSVEHVLRDLLAVHRTREALAREFRIDSPGYESDVYDLLCDLDAASEAEALAGGTRTP